MLIITYGCDVLTPTRVPALSHEHRQIGLFSAEEAGQLNMPQGYKQSIVTWYART